MPRLLITLIAGAAGLVVLAAPAGAQVELADDTATDPLVDTVEETVDGTVRETVDGTVRETVEDTGTTVTTLVETIDGADGDLTGDAVDLPGASLDVDAPDLVTDPVGSLEDIVAGETASEPMAVSGTDASPARSAESGTRDAGAAPEASPDASESRAGDGSLPAGVLASDRSTRPFVLTARDVGTFALPLVVAGLLCAYLGIDSWMRRREPVPVRMVEDRDEMLRFE